MTAVMDADTRDSEMINLLVAGVDDAFPALVRAFEDGVFSGLLRMVGNRADAEDLAQETFTRAYRSLRDFPPERIRALRIRGWLWTIAVNLARNRARTTSRKPPPLELTVPPVASALGPEDAALITEAEREWHRRLAALRPAQRTAVVLRHVVGLSYEEIAEATERPSGTVKADVHRGLAGLRAILDEEER
ncbi:MAG TPA: sigma-70 family RNA polymerase sigma factor [Acidimicrobiia bacterium]|nr:sigma-70 family RNA polymerase sigma factor [Acidimicrobiia bacterium]